MITAKTQNHHEIANNLMEKNPLLKDIHAVIYSELNNSKKISNTTIVNKLKETNSQVIGLHAPKRNGKDTFASYMNDAYNKVLKDGSFIRLGFGEPMKNMVHQLTNCPKEWLWGEDTERETPRDTFHGLSGRKVLQLTGNELSRKLYGQEFWTGLWNYQICENKLSEKSMVVIPDVRFEGDAKAVKNLNGLLLRIKRENLKNTDQHEAEKPLPYGTCDFSIKNEDLNKLSKSATYITKSVITDLPFIATDYSRYNIYREI